MQNADSYPIRLKVNYPDSLNRILNFPFFIGTVIKLILCIPILIILAIVGSPGGSFGGMEQYGDALGLILTIVGVISVVFYLIGPIGILFTGSYPRGLFNLIGGIQRITARTYAYLESLTDNYPGFGLEDDGKSTRLEIDYPPTQSRLLNFPFLGWLIKAILCIPHFVVLIFLGIAALVLVFIAQFAILFTGNFPRGMFGFVAGVLQWTMRVGLYIYGLTDRYPPFDLSADVEDGPYQAKA